MMLNKIKYFAKKESLTMIYLYSVAPESFYKKYSWKEQDRVR